MAIVKDDKKRLMLTLTLDMSDKRKEDIEFIAQGLITQLRFCAAKWKHPLIGSEFEVYIPNPTVDVSKMTDQEIEEGIRENGSKLGSNQYWIDNEVIRALQDRRGVSAYFHLETGKVRASYNTTIILQEDSTDVSNAVV